MLLPDSLIFHQCGTISNAYVEYIHRLGQLNPSVQNNLLFHPDLLLNEKYTQGDNHMCMASSCPTWCDHMTHPAHI